MNRIQYCYAAQRYKMKELRSCTTNDPASVAGAPQSQHADLGV